MRRYTNKRIIVVFIITSLKLGSLRTNFETNREAHSHFTYNVLLYAIAIRSRCLVNMTPVVKVVIHCVFELLYAKYISADYYHL